MEGCTIQNNSNRNIDHLSQIIQHFFPYAQEKLGFFKPVMVSFQSDEENANKLLGKTAHYNPDDSSIALYVDNRHPKDILRSFSHELVHHAQNCNGDFESAGELGPGYAQENEAMRNAELDAYKRGNIIFRDFEDLIKKGDFEIEIDFVKAGEPKMSLKEWKDNELNGLLMEKWGYKVQKEEQEIFAPNPGHMARKEDEPALDEAPTNPSAARLKQDMDTTDAEDRIEDAADTLQEMRRMLKMSGLAGSAWAVDEGARVAPLTDEQKAAYAAAREKRAEERKAAREGTPAVQTQDDRGVKTFVGAGGAVRRGGGGGAVDTGRGEGHYVTPAGEKLSTADAVKSSLSSGSPAWVSDDTAASQRRKKGAEEAAGTAGGEDLAKLRAQKAAEQLAAAKAALARNPNDQDGSFTAALERTKADYADARSKVTDKEWKPGPKPVRSTPRWDSPTRKGELEENETELRDVAKERARLQEQGPGKAWEGPGVAFHQPGSAAYKETGGWSFPSTQAGDAAREHWQSQQGGGSTTTQTGGAPRGPGVGRLRRPERPTPTPEPPRPAPPRGGPTPTPEPAPAPAPQPKVVPMKSAQQRAKEKKMSMKRPAAARGGPTPTPEPAPAPAPQPTVVPMKSAQQRAKEKKWSMQRESLTIDEARDVARRIFEKLSKEIK